MLAVLGVLFAALSWNEAAKRGEHAGGAAAPEGEAPARLEGGALVPVGGRELLTETPTSVRRSEGLQVEVVDAEGAPLAGADVYVLWIDEARESEFGFEDLPEAIEEEGEQGRTDERGSSWFSLGSGELVAVVARHGASFGMDFVELERTESQPLHLRLQVLADFDVTVRVLDPRGNPAENVPIVLACERHSLEETTDSDGEAAFEHFGSLRLGMGLEWTARADVLVPEPIRHEFGRLSQEAAAVLRLPPTGSVEVRVEDVDGEAVADGSLVWLGSPAIDGLERTGTKDGVAYFAHVGVGMELEARASRFGGLQEASPGLFTGPRRHGEAVEQKIVFGRNSSLLPLRVRRPEGRPFEGSLEVRVLGDTGRVTGYHLRPGDDGSYRLDLAQQPEEARMRIQVNAWTGERVGARFELVLPLPVGILPERELALEAAPILLAGRIVDVSGRPVATIEREDGNWDGLQLEYQTASGVTSASLRTDSDGRFEIRSFFAAEEIRVRVMRWNKGGELVRVPPGSADLVLVLDERE